MKAVVITPTKEKYLVEFGDIIGERTLASVLDEYIGRAWETSTLRVDFAHGCDMWLDEEGKFKHLPQNAIATSLWTRSYGLRDYIVGTVLITGGVDSDGATVGLTDEQVSALMNYTDTVHAAVTPKGLMYQ